MRIIPEEFKHWLNLEYLFNQILKLIKWLIYLIKKLILLLADVPFKIYFFIVAFIFIIVIGVIFYRLKKLDRKIKVRSLIRFEEGEKLSIERVEKWKNIENKINSDSIEDWKEAIVEADSILNDIFSRMGFKMDGLGEKLKNIEPGDFESLQDVWDAYKIRSRVAREGASFKISQEEAKAALAKYKKGLKELKYL